jgi:hypothetical protein
MTSSENAVVVKAKLSSCRSVDPGTVQKTNYRGNHIEHVQIVPYHVTPELVSVLGLPEPEHVRDGSDARRVAVGVREIPRFPRHEDVAQRRRCAR